MQSVLIVDDEKHTRDGLVAVLSDDYDVLAASNADEAIGREVYASHSHDRCPSCSGSGSVPTIR